MKYDAITRIEEGFSYREKIPDFESFQVFQVCFVLFFPNITISIVPGIECTIAFDYKTQRQFCTKDIAMCI